LRPRRTGADMPLKAQSAAGVLLLWLVILIVAARAVIA
jgi:hypothetical protein